MKKLLLLIFASLIIKVTQAQNQNLTKSDIVDFITKAIKNQVLADNPMLLINDVFVLNHEDLKNTLKFRGQLDLVEKNNKTMIKKYGGLARNGVVKISSFPESVEEDSIYNIKENVLYLLNDEFISQDKLKMIKPDMIESLSVIKDKKEILKYTFNTCDGIIKIKLKVQYRRG